MHEKFIEEVKMKCDKKNPYQQRNFFVENRIEDNLVFFMNFKIGTDDFVQTYCNRLRRELFKIDNMLNKSGKQISKEQPAKLFRKTNY